MTQLEVKMFSFAFSAAANAPGQHCSTQGSTGYPDVLHKKGPDQISVDAGKESEK